MTEEIERLTLRLEANVRQFENNIRRAQGESTRQFREIERRAQRMQRRVQAVMAGTFSTALLARFGSSTLRLAGDFEASMNRVQAALGATNRDMTALNDKARELGKTTQFAASEAADAIEVLAKNGLTADQILGGAVDASLRLAGALGGDLAASADLATDLMAQFKLNASDLPGIVDQVTGAALNSKFGFDDLRLAIGQAGGAAGGAGVEIQDFIAAIAAIAPNFASGSDAGTSFKTFIQRLTPESEKARVAMERLGLEFFDAAGNTKPLEEIAGELRGALQGLSEEARNEVLKTIFGTDALRAAIALMDQGEEGIRRLKSSIGDVSAEEQAAARMKGLNGALRELNSAWEDLLLTAANGGALDASTDAVQRLTDAIRYLSENFAEVMPWIERLAAALTGILIAKGLTLTTSAIIATGLALKAFIGTMVAAQAGTVTLGAALTALRGGPLLAIAAIAGITFLEMRRGTRDATAALDELQSKIVDANATTAKLEGVNRDLEKSKDDLVAASERYRQAVENEGPAVQSAAQLEIDAINARIAGREAEAETIAATLKLKEQEIAVAERAARAELLEPIRREIAPRGVRKGARSGATVPLVEEVSETDALAVLEELAKNARERILAGETREGDEELNRRFGRLKSLERQRAEFAEASAAARAGGFRRAEDLIPSTSTPPPVRSTGTTASTTGGGGAVAADLTPLQRISVAEGDRLRDAALQNRLIGKDAPERAYIETFERIMRDLRESGVTLAELQKDGYTDAAAFATPFANGARVQAEDRIQREANEALAADVRAAFADAMQDDPASPRSNPTGDARSRIEEDIAREEAKAERLRAILDRYGDAAPALPRLSPAERDAADAARRTALDDAAARAPDGLADEARSLEFVRLATADLERDVRALIAAQEDQARVEDEQAEARRTGRAALDGYIAEVQRGAQESERLQGALANGVDAYEAERLAIEAEAEATRHLNAAKAAGIEITEELAETVRAAAMLELEAERELRKAVEERREADARKQEDAKAATEALADRQREIDDAARSAGDAIGKTFESIITGSATAEDAVKSLILELGRMTLQKAVIDPISSGASGILGNVLSGVVGSVTGGFGGFGGAAAGTIGPGGTAVFAKGGIVSSPTVFGFDGNRRGLMGEAGPEAIMPLRRGPDGRLGVAAGGDGGARGGNTTINVNIATQDAASFQRSRSQISATLARAVDRGRRNM